MVLIGKDMAAHREGALVLEQSFIKGTAARYALRHATAEPGIFQVFSGGMENLPDIRPFLDQAEASARAQAGREREGDPAEFRFCIDVWPLGYKYGKGRLKGRHDRICVR
jgi:hypothetical protein